MYLDPSEIDLPSADELSQAQREQAQLDKSARLDQEFDNFFERLEIESGVPAHGAAMEMAPPTFAQHINYQRALEGELQRVAALLDLGGAPLGDLVVGDRGGHHQRVGVLGRREHGVAHLGGRLHGDHADGAGRR